MPIYEYRCPDCGEQFEEWQKMSDPPVTECSECGKGNVKKLLSAPAFHLKGGGWYSDHYGLKPSGGGGSEGSDGSGDTSDSGGTIASDGADSGSSDSDSSGSDSSGSGSSSSDSAGGDE